ncbi:DUF4097 family beta strand repeat-containing protein [Cohnella lupini]|uniref:Putative adhesin n=1 Tax=Cohnella lupini TaxID=1294267 RepID=A0A3D9I3G7_9BACL|nr:DUF4097 family beta strand repeat-containing protein [Cohnella lupini]RED56294.1 putative adhesin [Cohnella lupini]
MRKWIIVAFILLVIGLIGIGGTFSIGNMFDPGGVKVEQNQTVEGEGVRNIKVQSGSTDFQVVKGSTSKIKAYLTGQASEKYVDKIKLNLNRNGDAVNVSVESDIRASIGNTFRNLNLKLELPEQEYSSFVLESNNGDSNISELSADTINLIGHSGKMDMRDLTTGTLTSHVDSGDSDITEVYAKKIDLNASSGNITIEKLEASKLTINVSSGDIKIYDVDAELNVNGHRSNIRVELDELKHPMDINLSNGEVVIETDIKPASAQFKLYSGSGDLSNEWDGAKQSTDGEDIKNVVFGEGFTLVQVVIGSGNLSIGPR